MKIQYRDFGAIARIEVRATLPEIRRFNRVVDAAAFAADVAINRTGVFIKTARITGKTPAVMRAYRAVVRESAR